VRVKFNKIFTFESRKIFLRVKTNVEPHNNTVQVLIKQGWDIIEDKIEDMHKKAEAGLVSPIAFHMERCLMDIVTLAGYSGFPKWRVKRHLKPVELPRFKAERTTGVRYWCWPFFLLSSLYENAGCAEKRPR